MTSNIVFEELRKTGVRYSMYDRVYGSSKDYVKDNGLHLPPLKGTWKVCIINPRLLDVERIAEHGIPNHVEMTAYCNIELLRTVGATVEKRKSFDEFMEDYITTLGKPITPKAAKAVFYRTLASQDDIPKLLEELVSSSRGEIGIADVDKLLPESKQVWASDVVLSMFCYPNRLIPKRGHRFSGYKYKHPIKVLDEHIDIVGRDVSFFSIRKYLRTLLTAKRNYLDGKDVKSNMQTAVANIDARAILYAYILFEESEPDSLYALVSDITSRQSETEREMLL